MFKKLIASLLLLAAALTASAQVRGVTGKVTDDKGEALAGVSVIVKGSRIGTATDMDGNYHIPSAIPSDAVLMFSIIGFTTQEQPLGGNAAYNSTFTNNTVTSNVVLTCTLAGAADSPHMGLICGTNNPYTTAITGKVGAATIVKGDATTVVSAENYSSLLFGLALGAGATTTGVTFGN